MTVTVAEIWRYPIKGIGAEPLASVALSENRPLPLDRAWAVLEKGGEASDGWRACRNFLRGAKGPGLMAVTAQVRDQTITLSHPELDELTIQLDEKSADALFGWVRQIYPDTRQPPVALVKSPPEGMADSPFASVSVMNLSSLRAVADKVGQPMDVRRFRGNIWLDGLAPWEEFDLVGKTLQVGDVTLETVEPITRCRATEGNPATGKRDASVLQALQEGWGHSEFGITATVKSGGSIAQGDTVTIA